MTSQPLLVCLRPGAHFSRKFEDENDDEDDSCWPSPRHGAGPCQQFEIRVHLCSSVVG